MEDDRSALFNQLREFSQRKLKKVETKVVTGSGELLVEKRGAKGLQVLSGDAAQATQQEPARKLDLQVGLILPGLLLASQDVAHDKSSLETYGITHILNLDCEIENKFEDDYNYKQVAMKDKVDYDLLKVLDECFDFIDDGRHYGNVLVHCSGTVGLSRSSALCVAYLMNKEKQSYSEAFNNVKEVRSFVRPNEGFAKQLKEYEVQLRGKQEAKDSGIDDPFALRKKQEIEQEKAMVAGASSVKNRMKMFGANLEANPPGPRSKSVSPSPYKPANTSSTTTTTNSNYNNNQNSAATSKWSSQVAADKSASKSMTPEPRKSWQQPVSAVGPSPPPPPPPPMPSSNLIGNDKSMKPTTATSSNSSSKSSLPPPPPPPPPSASEPDLKPASIKSRYQPQASSKPPTSSSSSNNSNNRKGSVSETSEDETGGKRVFGRRPPPPMKIRGGLSIERQDSTNSDKQNEPPARRSNQHQLPQLRVPGSHGRRLELDAGGSMTADIDGTSRNNGLNLQERCPSPLVLMNNVRAAESPRICLTIGQTDSSGVQSELTENPFNYWQRTLTNRNESKPAHSAGDLPKRTVSLGPKRTRQIGESLQNNPFLRGGPVTDYSTSSSQLDQAAAIERRNSFGRAARELQSSLTELNKLIDSPSPSSAPSRRPAQEGRPPLAGPPLPPPRGSNKPPPPPPPRPLVCEESARRDLEEGSDGQREQRFMWQEDLANWKSSSSVNNLLSLFETSQSQSTLPPSSTRPRLNSTSVLRRTPWQDQSGSSSLVAAVGAGQEKRGREPDSDYTIRRTTSTSSSLKTRPVLRNPYRTQAKSSLQLPLKKQFTMDSDGESGQKPEDSRAPSPSAALRAAKQQAAARQTDSQHQESHSKPSGGQLNRSSTKKLLNLIKTKTKTDLTLSDGDENEEIDALLGALENESIENIDWDELGLDENEVKDIIKQGCGSSSSSSSSDDDDDDDDEEADEDEEEEVERSTLHYVIRTK